MLLVHGDDRHRESLLGALADHGAVLETASAGEALRARKWSGWLTAAVIDRDLADMSAWELALELRRHQEHLPIIGLGWAPETPRFARFRSIPQDGPIEALLAALDDVGIESLGVRGRHLDQVLPTFGSPPSQAGLMIVATLEGEVTFLTRSAKQLFGIEGDQKLRLDDLSTHWAPPFPTDESEWEVDLALPDGHHVRACQTVSVVTEPDEHPRVVIAIRPLATHCPRLGEVLASENRFRVLLEELHVGVVVQDREDRILISNPVACELLGLTRDQLHGKTSFDPDWNVVREDGTPFDPQEHPSVVAMAREEAVRDVVMGVYRPVTKDRIWILVSAEPVRDERGRLERVIVTFSDITAYKAAKDQLERLQRLESAGALAAGVAHDFNNVLGAIMTCAETMLLESGQGHSRELAENIFAAAEQGASLTRKLLTFARDQSSRPEHVRVDHLVKDLVPLLRRTLPTSIRLVTDLNLDDATTFIDPTELERALLNLVLNARDAQPDGGEIRLRTQVVAGSEVRELELTVSDAGSGISPEILDRIFEPLFSTKDPGKGTGLGLAMVYGIVSAAGGRIEPEPTERGTTFRIRLPDTTPEGRATDSIAPRTGAPLVMVVDDDALQLDQIRRILTAAGYAVETAHDGREAWDRLRAADRERPRLILSDIVMPGSSGVELAEKVSDHYGIPVRFMSGHPFGTHPGPAMAVSLQKPFSRDELLSTVESALQSAGP